MKHRTGIQLIVIWLTLICAVGGRAESGNAAPSNSSKDPKTMDPAKNLCVNGDFEQLQEAAARPLPQGWSEARHSGDGGVIDIANDAASGKHALHLSSPGAGVVGMNSPNMAAGHGRVQFRYKALKSSADGANLALVIIGINGPNGLEVARQACSPPKEHVGDGQWHEAIFDFDFSAVHAAYCLVAPRVNENVAHPGEGEWLIDGIVVNALHLGPQLKVARVWSDKPLARTGDAIKFSAFIENNGDEAAADVAVALKAPAGLTVGEANQNMPALAVGGYHRLDWSLKAEQAGPMQIEVAASLKAIGDKTPEKATYKVLVIDRNTTYTRQELCTDQAGYWRLLERPATLQQGNTGALTPVVHKTSAEIKHNTYGICTHLPRSKDYEDPFNPAHLIDGDPETCWSSQQNNTPYPGVAPWAEIDLGQPVTVKQVNLIPYWHNTDFPVGFSIRASVDGQSWQTVRTENNYSLVKSEQKRGDKFVQSFALDKPVKARQLRVDFERLPPSGGNYAEVSVGFKARLSGIEVLDETGRNVALKDAGASIKASDYFTGWQNTAKTVNESFGKIFDIGYKWVRVSQWGDQTEWAAVEREKGKFQVDPVTDAGIHKLADNGVDILYGLNYGNSLYHDRKEPWGDMGPIYREGHPFYLNNGPRTEEERQAFVRYVDYVVRRYKGQVKYWELWNEENGWYPGFEPELYGKLFCAVGKQIKAIDPAMQVMFGGTAAPAPITTEISLREGGAPYVDLAAFHPYGIDKPEGGMGTMEQYQGKNVGQSREQTGWNHLEEIIEGVKKPYAQHGRPDVKVWLNEFGTNLTGLDFAYDPHIGEYGCAKVMMRFYIYSGWLGSPAGWWALYNENMSQDWGIIDQKDYSLRPMSLATQNVCSVVSDVQPIKTLDFKYEGTAPDPKVIGYKKDDGGDTLALAWAAVVGDDEVRAYPSKLSFKLPAKPTQVTLTDLYWGVTQPAVWTYEAGTLTVDGLVVRDYPVVITCH